MSPDQTFVLGMTTLRFVTKLHAEPSAQATSLGGRVVTPL